MFEENNISLITEQDFAGLPNLNTLDLSKNKLGDESFALNSLNVSTSAPCACCR